MLQYDVANSYEIVEQKSMISFTNSELIQSGRSTVRSYQKRICEYFFENSRRSRVPALMDKGIFVYYKNN